MGKRTRYRMTPNEEKMEENGGQEQELRKGQEEKKQYRMDQNEDKIEENGEHDWSGNYNLQNIQ